MHVFLSYAREDREKARRVAVALETKGWSVWWDRKLVAGQTFDRTIEEQLRNAVAVVVLWSTNSVESEWVRNEASAANDRGLLVPAVLDDTSLPLEFRRHHAADLSGWNGDLADGEFQTLLQGLIAKRDIHGSAPGAHPAASATVIPVRVPQPSTQPAPVLTSPVFSRHAWVRPLVYLVGALALAFVIAGWLAGGSVNLLSTNSTMTGGRWQTSELTPTVGRSPDAPVAIPLETLVKMRLRPQEAAYLRLAEPMQEFSIVVDLRLVDNVRSHLGTTVSVLDENGATIRDSLIWIGATAYGRTIRQTAIYEATKPRNLGFKVVNGSNLTDVWLTVRPARAGGLVPFFGEVVPTPIALGQSHTGQLGLNQEAYYQATLPIGAYDAILEFTRSTADQGQIFGNLGKSSSDGGSWAQLLYFQGYGKSDRQSARFVVSEAGPIVFSMVNTVDVVDYLFRVQPALSAVP